ncbi:MAG: methanethiol S-methyltransferase [Pseudomonadota bacterium]
MTRLAVFAYGLLSYLAFLIVFAYLAGFLLEVLVPKAINDPMLGAQSGTALWVALPINLGLIALFGITHSMMARDWFKRAFMQILPQEAERSTYVLQSSVFLALAMWQWRPLDMVVWSVDGPLAWALYASFALGTGILLLSTFLIDHFELFGLRQIWSNLRGRPMVQPEFRTPLLYRVVRHPMQLGIMILLLSTPHMTAGHLLFASSMIAYIFVGLYFEERSLLRSFGARYEAYQAQVPMLIPGLPRRRHALRS